MPFSPSMQSAVSRINKCLRAYLVLTTCDDASQIYIKSHNDVATPVGATSTAQIIDIGNNSQNVNFASSVTTTGSFTFKIADVDRTFSQWMRDMKQCTLSGSTVSIFIGYEDVQCDEYYCAGTYVIKNLRAKHKIYTITAKDPQSLGNNDIFQERCFKHFGDLYEDQIPPLIDENGDRRDEAEREGTIRRDTPAIFEDTGNPTGNTTVTFVDDTVKYGELYLASDELVEFEYVIQDLNSKPYFNRFSGIDADERMQKIGFIKHNCEIMLVKATIQWTESAIQDDPFTPENEFRSEISGYAYDILERGLFGSPRSRPENEDGIVIKDGDEICVAPILEGDAGYLLNAIMTGNDLQGNPVLENDGSAVLKNAGINQKFVDVDCLQDFNEPLQFVCPPPYKAKTFWQEQILRWTDSHFIVNCDGKMCLTRRNAPEDSAVVRTINAKDIVDCGNLELDSEVTTSFFIAWDYDPCEERFLNTVGSFIDAEETECLEDKQDFCQFLGVRTDLSNYQLIKQKACRTLYRDGIPRWNFNLTVCIEFADIQPGQKIRVVNGLVLDYFGSQMTLDRAFEVNSNSADWRRGTVTFNLSAPVKESIGTFSLEKCFEARQPCATNHCDGRTDLLDEIGTYNIPAGDVQPIPSGNYCVNGDLVIDGVLKQSTPGTLNIVATGVITVNGKIDTSGMGEPGHTGITQNTQGNFYGDNISQGARAAACFSVFCQCSGTDRAGYICAGKVYNFIDVTKYSDTNTLDLSGSGGCNGRDSSWRQAIDPTTGIIKGGAGGNGGGGLILGGSGFSLSNGCIDTSGNDGEVGQTKRLFASSVDGQPANSLIALAGSGSGGNAGRVLIITDGPVPASIGSTNFVASERGITPNQTGLCASDNLGSSNVNRKENVIQITQIACGGKPLGN